MKLTLKQLTREELYKFDGLAATTLSVMVDEQREMQENEGLTEEDGLVSMKSFRFYIVEKPPLVPPSWMGNLAGAIIAEPIQVSGPREPAFIWSGHRWFCSEDEVTPYEHALAERLNEIAPGGIGGF